MRKINVAGNNNFLRDNKKPIAVKSNDNYLFMGIFDEVTLIYDKHSSYITFLQYEVTSFTETVLMDWVNHQNYQLIYE